MECHTRAQKSDFKNRIKNITNIQPALLEMIYQELILDSLTASHLKSVQRIRVIILGANRSVTDLKLLNPGRPRNKYDVFFTNMEALMIVTCRSW